MVVEGQVDKEEISASRDRIIADVKKGVGPAGEKRLIIVNAPGLPLIFSEKGGNRRSLFGPFSKDCSSSAEDSI